MCPQSGPVPVTVSVGTSSKGTDSASADHAADPHPVPPNATYSNTSLLVGFSKTDGKGYGEAGATRKGRTTSSPNLTRRSFGDGDSEGTRGGIQSSCQCRVFVYTAGPPRPDAGCHPRAERRNNGLGCAHASGSPAHCCRRHSRNERRSEDAGVRVALASEFESSARPPAA